MTREKRPADSALRREQQAMNAAIKTRQERFAAGYALGASQTLDWCLGLLAVKPSRMLEFIHEVTPAPTPRRRK